MQRKREREREKKKTEEEKIMKINFNYDLYMTLLASKMIFHMFGKPNHYSYFILKLQDRKEREKEKEREKTMKINVNSHLDMTLLFSNCYFSYVLKMKSLFFLRIP